VQPRSAPMQPHVLPVHAPTTAVKRHTH